MTREKFPDVRWIFFDWGGTLKDELAIYRGIAQICVSYLRQRSVAVDESKLYERLIELERLYETVGLRQALEEFAVPAQHIAGAEKAVDASFPQPWFDGAIDVIKSLSQTHRLGIISNNHVTGFEKFVAEQGMSPYFDVVVGSTDAGIKKPDPLIFQAALERAGCGPEQALMVGDRITKDICGANSVGMRTVRIRQGIYADEEPTSSDEVADAEIADIRELPGLLSSASVKSQSGG